MPMNFHNLTSMFAVLMFFIIPIASIAKPSPDENLKVVIIRHGEKPESGDNLSCQGENRALQLPALLYSKFGSPAFTYIPSLGLGEETKHARMFQTVSPFAIKHNLMVNSQFGEKEAAKVAKEVRKKAGTVLLVWEHSAIPDLADKLGVKNPPGWGHDDFDSIWIITYNKGTASLSLDKEGLQPSADCSD
jgi:hypothetical protein